MTRFQRHCKTQYAILFTLYLFIFLSATDNNCNSLADISFRSPLTCQRVCNNTVVRKDYQNRHKTIYEVDYMIRIRSVIFKKKRIIDKSSLQDAVCHPFNSFYLLLLLLLLFFLIFTNCLHYFSLCVKGKELKVARLDQCWYLFILGMNPRDLQSLFASKILKF